MPAVHVFVIVGGTNVYVYNTQHTIHFFQIIIIIHKICIRKGKVVKCLKTSREVKWSGVELSEDVNEKGKTMLS